MSQTRRLAAILAADVARYSPLIETDEEGTLNRLSEVDPRRTNRSTVARMRKPLSRTGRAELGLSGRQTARVASR